MPDFPDFQSVVERWI